MGDELTSEGFIKEGTDMLRKAREACGRAFENEMYRRTLELAVKPNDKDEPDDSAFVSRVLNTSYIAAGGLMEDYSDVVKAKPKVGEAMAGLSVNVAKAVGEEFERVISDYQNLDFTDGTEISRIAANEREAEYLRTAAGLLGYEVEDVDGPGGQFKATVIPRYKIGGNLDKVIATRVNVGLKGLDEDFDAEKMRRPIRRMVASMVGHMAQTMRTPVQAK